MALLRDQDGNFYEASAEILNQLTQVEPPVAGDNFPASDYRWDPREGSAEGTEIAGYHWQPPAYHWQPTDYRWNPPQPTGGSAPS
jgi:hypothetical protein